MEDSRNKQKEQLSGLTTQRDLDLSQWKMVQTFSYIIQAL